MFDFSFYKNNGKYYGGSERKIGILINGENFMLKFRKKTPFGTRFNHISEYIGSKIFKELGFTVQDVYLGLYYGEEVVACKDFNNEGQFVPFNEVGESTIEEDKEKYQYSYEDIMEMLKLNNKLTEVDSTISLFWDMFIVDAFIGNFDRHGANWGFIKKNNKYSAAPIFDNGSCLFPNLIDEDEMLNIMNSEEETNKRVFNFPTSQVKLNNKKSSYYKIINSLKFDECNNALKRIYKKIKMNNIFKIIDDTDFITDVHKDFYKYMLTKRYKLIIEASFKKLEGIENETI